MLAFFPVQNSIVFVDKLLFDETVFRCFPFFQTNTQGKGNLGVMKRYIAVTATEAQKHDVAPLISLRQHLDFVVCGELMV